MTIIQPNKNKNLIYLLSVLGFTLVAAVSFYILIYSKTVSLKHDIGKIKTELEIARVRNAELKNKFYSEIDSRNLDVLSKEKGLIYDKNPQWEFASQL